MVMVAALTVSVKDTLPVKELASVAVTVAEKAPPAVGVPVNAPVEAFKVIPAGNVPEVTAYVYGAVPPLAENVVEV